MTDVIVDHATDGAGARARIEEAYGSEAHRRLLALNAKYDPNDTFRLSFPLAGLQKGGPRGIGLLGKSEQK